MCYLYHLSVKDDLAQAFRRLKFLAQNPQKFTKNQLFTAFMVTQFQILGAILNESVTILFMTRQSDLIDLVMNFVAFEAIINVDNLCRTSSGNQAFLRISKVGKITYARDSAKGKSGDYENERPNTFSDPQIEDGVCLWKFISVVQRIQRTLYKGIYFYMFPYFVVPLSYLVYNHY